MEKNSLITLWTLSGNKFLYKKNIPLAPNISYYHDLNSGKLLLFAKIKTHFHDYLLGTPGNIQQVMKNQLKC